MPTTYAHYRFGQEVRGHLREEIQKIISENETLYNIGLHGPDLLFYYRPIGFNRINQTGVALHNTMADEFFKNGKKMIKKYSDNKVALAYLFGFICHFMLDSECHPYINESIKTIAVSHSAMEAEMDRMLMIKDGLDPIKYKPTSHIKSDKRVSRIVALFYPDISPKKIGETIRTMRRVLNILVPSNKAKRALQSFALLLTGNNPKLSSLVLKIKPNELCNESNEILEKLYNDCIISTARLITEFYEELDEDGPLNPRLSKKFK